MRSATLDMYMRNGYWTAERIHAQLNGISLSHLEKVLAQEKCPSAALATAIKNIVCPQKTKVSIVDLFPLLKDRLPANSISTPEVRSTGSTRHSRSNRAQRRHQSEPILSV